MTQPTGSVTEGPKKYTPRLRSPQYDRFIRAHLKTVKVLEGAGLLVDSVIPGDWRSWIAQKVERDLLRTCNHTVCSIFEVENEHGVWGVEICNNCGAQTAKECPHVQLEWREDGTALICTNCGHDGT